MKSLLVSWLVFKLALSLGVSFQDFFHQLTTELRDNFMLDEQHTSCCTMPQSDCILGSTMKVPSPRGEGGGTWVKFLLGMCRCPRRAPTPL